MVDKNPYLSGLVGLAVLDRIFDSKGDIERHREESRGT